MIPNVKPNVLPNVLPNVTWDYGAPVATITHNKNGTFAITFRGTNGAVIYCDPGDGSPVQPKTLLGLSTDVTFSYTNDGTQRSVSIYGELDQIKWITAANQYINGDVKDIFRGMHGLNRIATYGNSAGTTQDIQGDISILSNLDINIFQMYYNFNLGGDVSPLLQNWSNLSSFNLGGPPLTGPHTCSRGTWVCNSVTLLSLTSCFSTSEDVGNAILNAAGVQTAGTLALAGTCPAPPSTPEVTAALAELAGDGVTVFTS